MTVDPRQVEIEKDDVGPRRIAVVAAAIEKIERRLAVRDGMEAIGDLGLLQALLVRRMSAGLSSTSRISIGRMSALRRIAALSRRPPGRAA